MDFTVISRAGLTQAEFAELVGVSRVAVNSWATGKSKPIRFIAKEVNEAMAAMELAIRNGALPIGADIPKQSRVNIARHIVVAASSGLSEAPAP